MRKKESNVTPISNFYSDSYCTNLVIIDIFMIAAFKALITGYTIKLNNISITKYETII